MKEEQDKHIYDQVVLAGLCCIFKKHQLVFLLENSFKITVLLDYLAVPQEQYREESDTLK